MAYSKIRKTAFKNGDAIKAKILELYQSELNNFELAKQVGCSRAKLSHIMFEMGIKRPRRKAQQVGVPEARVLAMLDEYVNRPEKHLEQIAEDYEVSVATLCRYARERGTPRRKPYKMFGNPNAKGAPKGHKTPVRSWITWTVSKY